MTRCLVPAWLLVVGLLAAAPAVSNRELISQLGARAFADRQAAQADLLQRGETDHATVLADCLAAYTTATDPEVKMRLRELMAILVETRIRNRPRAYLGIRMAAVPPIVVKNGKLIAGNIVIQNAPPADPVVLAGIQVQGVLDDSPAAAAGLEPGDLILQMDDLDLRQQPSTRAFITQIQSHPPGTRVTLTVRRGEETRTVPIALGILPEELQAEALSRQPDAATFFNDWLQEQLARPQPDSR